MVLYDEITGDCLVFIHPVVRALRRRNLTNVSLMEAAGAFMFNHLGDYALYA